MKPLRIIAAGIFETLAHLWEWYCEEMQDKPHTLPPREPDREPTVVLRCRHNARLNSRCLRCDSGALNDGQGFRHDGGKSGGGSPYGH